ncbi:YraN family protein [candidate division WWE3 bacterium]|nr:YraN family protein [candidate division WWE3 bacterium]
MLCYLDDVSNVLKGKFGENFACKYLASRGYKIITRNWRCRRGEIDIICRINDVTVFVEVKYRTSDRFGEPYEAVGSKKQKSLARSIMFYLFTHDLIESSWRLDVLSLSKIPGRIRVSHFEGVEL